MSQIDTMFALRTAKSFVPRSGTRLFSAARILNGSVTQTIKDDHREIESYFNTILKSNDPDERTRFQNQLTWELARHSIAEELIVYPAFEKYIVDGHAMAERDRGEHQTVFTLFFFFLLISS